MRLAGAAQAELIKVAAVGLVAVAAYYAVKSTAQTVASAVDDAVDNIIGPIQETWTDTVAAVDTVVTAPILQPGRMKDIPITPAPIPLGPAGIIGWMDRAITAITAYVTGK